MTGLAGTRFAHDSPSSTGWRVHPPLDGNIRQTESQGHLRPPISADRRFPEIVKPLCDGGADFLICPSGGMFGSKTNDPILQARSKENEPLTTVERFFKEG